MSDMSNPHDKEVIPTYSDTGGIKRVGHINWAHERGSYSGCRAKVFMVNDGPLDEQMNEYFAHTEHAVLVVDIKPVFNGVLCFFTRKYTDTELERLNHINAKVAELEEEEKHKRLEMEKKADEAIALKNKQIADDRKKLMRRTELLFKAALKHLRNCKKATPAEIAEAQADLEALKHIDDPVPEVKDDLPAVTNLAPMPSGEEKTK